MAQPVLSQQDYYDIFQTVMQSNAPELTDWADGSINDSQAGVWSICATEITKLIVAQFRKTLIELADGPEITGGPDDLQTLAVDHYGATFARPLAVAAIDTVTFSRANNSQGQVTILAGSIVKTQPDASGNSQRYATQSNVILTNTSNPSDLTGSTAVIAVVAGAAGSASASTITVIETSLTDSSIVVTNAGNATGADAQDDATYRETIRNLIESLSGGTLIAVEAKAKTVTGIQTATAVEQVTTVIQYNIATSSVVGQAFSIVHAILYVADATGTASAALLTAVRAAIDTVRSAGVKILVAAATPQSLNWTATMTLNPSGPNYATLSVDNSTILAAMQQYVNALPVGTNFVRATANAAILALYGAAGTNDMTAFTTSVPTGDVAAGSATTKIIAGTMSLV